MTTHSNAVDINGSKQWIYLNKLGSSARTLFFLHGGPGWADAPFAHLICKDLFQKFNIVHWDQRGTNRSYNKEDPTPKITTEQLLSDAEAILQWLEDEHKIKTSIAIGHSWGSLLGVKLISKIPNRFEGYVGLGQYVTGERSEPLSQQDAIQKAKDQNRADLVSELERFPPDFYKNLGLLFRQREIVSILGGEFKQTPSETEFKEWLDSAPEAYRSTWSQMYSSCVFSCQTLWPELLRSNLIRDYLRIPLPVLLIHGKFDLCTHPQVAKEWFNLLQAPPGKEYIEFENSAHWPQIEENAKFVKIICERWNRD